MDEAERLAREAGDGFEAARGPANPETLSARETLGIVLQNLGRLSEAEVLFADLVEVAGVAGRLKRAAVFRLRLGKCLVAQERRDEAEPVLVAAHAELLVLLGDGADATREAARALAELRETAARSSTD